MSYSNIVTPGDSPITLREVEASIEEIQSILDEDDRIRVEPKETEREMTPEERKDYEDQLSILQNFANDIDEVDRDEPLEIIENFGDHAFELAKELHGSKAFDHWPMNCIDWERAGSDLSHDYSQADFGDETYYYRE